MCFPSHQRRIIAAHRQRLIYGTHGTFSLLGFLHVCWIEGGFYIKGSCLVLVAAYVNHCMANYMHKKTAETREDQLMQSLKEINASGVLDKSCFIAQSGRVTEVGDEIYKIPSKPGPGLEPDCFGDAKNKNKRFF